MRGLTPPRCAAKSAGNFGSGFGLEVLFFEAALIFARDFLTTGSAVLGCFFVTLLPVLLLPAAFFAFFLACIDLVLSGSGKSQNGPRDFIPTTPDFGNPTLSRQPVAARPGL